MKLEFYRMQNRRNRIHPDLEDEEKDLLKDALMNINPDIFGDCYTVPKQIPLLRDLEEYSYILDACGKNKKQGLGLSIALGEKDQALDAALRLQRQYRDQIVKGLEWIKREGAVQLSDIQYLYSEDKVLKSVMGTIASIGLSVELLDNSKPVIGMSRLHNDIKISGRTTTPAEGRSTGDVHPKRSAETLGQRHARACDEAGKRRDYRHA